MRPGEYSELPDWAQQQLADVEPTGEIDGRVWHEVQFDKNGIICQLAVINRRFVAFPAPEVSDFARIVRVLSHQDFA